MWYVWRTEEVPTGLWWRDLRERTIWKTLRRRNGVTNMDLTTGRKAWNRLIWLRIVQVASCAQGKETWSYMTCGVLTS